MANVTWKRVFTSADTIPLANGGTNSTTVNIKGFIRNSGTAHETVTATAGQILVGQGQAKPAPKSVGGVITMNGEGSTSFVSGQVSTDALGANVVTLNEMQHGTTGDILVYGTAADGTAPTRLPIGGNGQVLSVDLTTDGNGDLNSPSKLKFISAPPAANSTVNDGAGNTNALPVVIASGVATNATLQADASGFTFDSAQGFGHVTGADLGSAGTASVASTNGFKGNLAGTASASNLQKVAVGAASSSSSLLLAPNSTTNGQYVTPEADNNLQWDGSKLKITGALEVVGDVTQTSVNVVNSEFDDVLIKVAGGAGNDGAATTAGPNGVGIAVDNGTATDDKLARFVYKGFDDSASVLGWRIAQAANNTASAIATTYGVGVMSIRAAAATEASLADTGQQGALDIGIGAMLFSTDATSGGLFIQVGG